MSRNDVLNEYLLIGKIKKKTVSIERRLSEIFFHRHFVRLLLLPAIT